MFTLQIYWPKHIERVWTLMICFLITALIGLGLLWPDFCRAATMLSDSQLVAVSGGGADLLLDGQSLPQEQQQPDNNSSITSNLQPQSNDGIDLAPELFAILQSNIDAKREREIRLNGEAQQGASALNLENSLSSDVVASNNIFDGSSIALGGVSSEVEINQLNSLTQLHRSQGELNSSIAGHRYEKTVESRSGSESYDYRIFSSIYLQRESRLKRSDYINSTAQVGSRFTSLGEFTDGVLPLPIVPVEKYGPYFKIDPIGIIIDTYIAGKWGGNIGYNGVTLYGPGVSIDSISAGGTDNKDLLLGVSGTLPKLDCGDIVITGCVGACNQMSWPLPDIGGETISSEFVIKDMGPEIDEMNFGTGIAVSGQMIPATPVSSGNISISGEAALKVTPYARLTLDMSKLSWLGVPVGTIIKDSGIFKDANGNNINILTKTWSFDLIDANIAFDLLDEELSIDPINIVQEDLDHLFIESLSEQNNTIEIYDAVDVAESSFNETYEHSAFTGGQVTNAQAELLAMSDGTLSVDNNSTIALADSAQSNIQVINGVNAVSSVAANAMNVTRLPAFRAGGSVRPQTLIQQQNFFNQQL